METQPQLLLLQKTMMVTEGVGRMLNPKLNIWELARPMMEEWADEHFGIAGKIRDGARQGYDIARKLPVMLEYVENAMKSFGDPKGIQLHPLTVEAMNAPVVANQRQWLRLGWAALLVATLLGIFLLLK
jgi:ubiquinone biosynthesis protein